MATVTSACYRFIYNLSETYLTLHKPIHGAQTDVGNREFLHEYNAVCVENGSKTSLQNNIEFEK